MEEEANKCAKTTVKTTKNTVLTELYNAIDIQKITQSLSVIDKIPHRLVVGLYDNSSSACTSYSDDSSIHTRHLTDGSILQII